MTKPFTLPVSRSLSSPPRAGERNVASLREYFTKG